jgi:chemotaxis protein MotB
MGCLVTGKVAGAECEFQIFCSKGRATIMIRMSIPLRKHTGWAIAVPLVALLLSACESQSAYDDLQAQNQQLQAQNQQLQAQIAALQREATFVEAGDLLFPPGGFELSPAGQAELKNNIVPKLINLQNAKVVVYGYTDNTPVGPALLQQAGVNDNLTLSSRRAGAVVTFLVSQGVNPNIISAKGFGETHPVASNDTPAGRAKNRRIVITIQGPGAPGA